MNAKRLLRLAEILERADAEHKRRGEPGYRQAVFRHADCRTPACALGHWAQANPIRWKWHERVPRLRNRKKGLPLYTTDAIDDAAKEFRISKTDAIELFDGYGCGEARTAKAAAKYIRRFVARKLKELD